MSNSIEDIMKQRDIASSDQNQLHYLTISKGNRNRRVSLAEALLWTSEAFEWVAFNVTQSRLDLAGAWYTEALDWQQIAEGIHDKLEDVPLGDRFKETCEITVLEGREILRASRSYAMANFGDTIRSKAMLAMLIMQRWEFTVTPIYSLSDSPIVRWQAEWKYTREIDGKLRQALESKRISFDCCYSPVDAIISAANTLQSLMEEMPGYQLENGFDRAFEKSDEANEKIS